MRLRAVAPSSRIVVAADALTAGEDRIGGKARGLGRLVAAGARVPAFFAVPVEVFAAHLDAAGLTSAVAAALAALPAAGERAAIAAAAAALQAQLGALALDADFAAELAAAVERLGAGPFAVRSSMVGEDSTTRSFAGQLDSFLHQRAQDVPGALVACWASAFSARALAYQRQAGAVGLPRIAVVVQRMIDGRASGVLFTRDPVSGRDDVVRVSGCFGLGEGVVSGACNSDEYLWSPTDGEVSVTVAHKDLAVVRAPGGVGTVEVAVEPARAASRCLSADELATLGRAGLAVAAAMGAPQDLEWTFADDGLHLLQARPITARTPAGAIAAPAEGPRVVWDNSNIQESYCGVTTPLTFSFAVDAYTNVYNQTFRMLGTPASVLADYQPVFRNLLGLIRGRVYYNINNWYRTLLLLPSFGRNKEDMERMMGLDSPVDFVVDEVLSPVQRLRRLPRVAGTTARLLSAFATLDRDVATFMREFDAVVARFNRPRLGDAGYSRLIAILDEARGELLGRWHTPIVNDIYVMMMVGKLRRFVERVAGVEQAPRLMSSLMAAEEGVESVEPTRQLLRIARLIRDAGAADELRAGEPAAALASLRARHADVDAALTTWLERYGDRCMGELKLETVSLREDPRFVVQVLRNYVGHAQVDPDALAADEQARRRAAEAEVEGRLNVLERRRFRKALVDARRGIRHREAMRLQRTRAFGLHRDLYLALGKRLHEAGRLDQPRDVFYLTTQEIGAYHDGTAVAADLAPLARARRAEMAGYERERMPNRFETVGPVHHGNAIAAPAASADERAAAVLRGLGCSPGVVEAPLQVIESPQDDLALEGKILTALRTDPGWAPLFPSARAVLIERGSTLSHSAVLARELGLPAVVGVANLLQIVKSGERVRLDGGSGVVERLDGGGERRDGAGDVVGRSDGDGGGGERSDGAGAVVGRSDASAITQTEPRS